MYYIFLVRVYLQYIYWDFLSHTLLFLELGGKGEGKGILDWSLEYKKKLPYRKLSVPLGRVKSVIKTIHIQTDLALTLFDRLHFFSWYQPSVRASVWPCSCWIGCNCQPSPCSYSYSKVDLLHRVTSRGDWSSTKIEQCYLWMFFCQYINSRIPPFSCVKILCYFLLLHHSTSNMCLPHLL